MYCKNCGSKIDNNSKFCIFCGEKLDYSNDNANVVKSEAENNNIRSNNNNCDNNHVIKKKGPWNGFAKAGFTLGIVSLAISWIPIYGFIFALSLGIPGIVLSTLGKKSAIYASKASVGLTLSIISIPVSIILFVIMLVSLSNM